MARIENKPVYVCETCRKEYLDKQEALKCEDGHRCICSKQLLEREEYIEILYSHRFERLYDYWSTNIGIDYKSGVIFKASYNLHQYTTEEAFRRMTEMKDDISFFTYTKLQNICTCPKCGKRINKFIKKERGW